MKKEFAYVIARGQSSHGKSLRKAKFDGILAMSVEYLWSYLDENVVIFSLETEASTIPL